MLHVMHARCICIMEEVVSGITNENRRFLING